MPSALLAWMRENFDTVRGDSPRTAAKVASHNLGYTVKPHDVTRAFNAVDSERNNPKAVVMNELRRRAREDTRTDAQIEDETRSQIDARKARVA